MKVGIIGSGVVGQTLAAGFLKHGHQVEIGTRDPAKLKDWSASTSGAAVKSFAEAAAFGDVVVLAVGGEVAQQALTLIGSSALQGKTVIDAVKSDRRRATGEWNPSILHPAEPVADGAAAGGLSVRSFRQSVQFCRQWPDGQSAVRQWKADHVHLRQ